MSTEEEYVKGMLECQLGCGKYSETFIKLLVRMKNANYNIHKVFDEIALLEGVTQRSTGTKKASVFTKRPLNGLWHKHFFDMQFFLKNMINDIHSPEATDIIERMATGLSNNEPPNKYISELIHGRFLDRFAKNKLTGEWIVFCKHDGINYYLCLGAHDAQHDVLINVRHCVADFPFLKF